MSAESSAESSSEAPRDPHAEPDPAAGHGAPASGPERPVAARPPAPRRPLDAAEPAPAGRRGRRARSGLRTAAVMAVTVTALPAAALTLPDAGQGVLDAARDELGLDDAGTVGLVRAVGATLPALLVAVPAAAVAVRRLPARAVLLAGLLCLLGGLVASRYADSVPSVAAARAAQGVGAGVTLPATLVLVLERRRALPVALWAGTLAAVLLAALPAALRAAPRPDPATGAVEWRTAFAPYPQAAALALGAALLFLLVGGAAPAGGLPAARTAERGQLLLPAVPAAGLGFLALVAAHGWSPGGQLVVAGAAVATLVGLAVVGSRDAIVGSPLGCAVVMVAVGLLAYPVTGPLSGLAQRAAGEGAVPSALPFAAAACAAVAGALCTVRLSREGAQGAVLGGFGLVVIAVLLTLAANGTGDRWTLTACLVPLGAGLGTALAASMREATAGAALYGLALCPPALLSGQLIALSLQAGHWQRTHPQSAAQQLQALTAGYRAWLVAAGVLTVALAAVSRRASSGATRRV